MNVLEVIEQLEAGKSIDIHTSDAMEFMRECERHCFTETIINMSFDGPKCTLSTSEKFDDETASPQNED